MLSPKVTEIHRLSPYIQPDAEQGRSGVAGLVWASLMAVPIMPKGDEKR